MAVLCAASVLACWPEVAASLPTSDGSVMPLVQNTGEEKYGRSRHQIPTTDSHIFGCPVFKTLSRVQVRYRDICKKSDQVPPKGSSVLGAFWRADRAFVLLPFSPRLATCSMPGIVSLVLLKDSQWGRLGLNLMFRWRFWGNARMLNVRTPDLAIDRWSCESVDIHLVATILQSKATFFSTFLNILSMWSREHPTAALEFSRDPKVGLFKGTKAALALARLRPAARYPAPDGQGFVKKMFSAAKKRVMLADRLTGC